MNLSSEEIERYARHIVLREIGGPGQAKLKAARVLWSSVPGGSAVPILQYLAAAGIGVLGIVDPDIISVVEFAAAGDLFATETVSDKAKSLWRADQLSRLNPHIRRRTP